MDNLTGIMLFAALFLAFQIGRHWDDEEDDEDDYYHRF